MALVLDTPFPVSAPLAADMVAGNAIGIVRYVENISLGAPLTPAELALLQAAGLKVTACYESSGRSGSGGAGLGQTEATALVRGARAAGLPPGVTLFLSAFDYAVSPSEAATCQAYIWAGAAVLHAAGYKAGFYGPVGLAQDTTGWDKWWQSESTGFWGNASPWSGAALVQKVSLAWNVAGQLDTDGNDCQDPSIFDPPAPAPAPSPTPEEDDLFYLRHKETGVYYLGMFGGIYAVGAGADPSTFTGLPYLGEWETVALQYLVGTFPPKAAQPSPTPPA